MLSRFLIHSSKLIQPIKRNIFFSITRFDRYGRENLRARLDKFKYEKKPVNNFFNQNKVVFEDIIPVRPKSHLLKALGFTLLITVGSFTIAAIVRYERTKKQLRLVVDDMEDFFKNFMTHSHKPQIQLGLHQKVIMGIIGINIIVTLLWKIPSFIPFMTTHFTNSFAQKKLCFPMLTSCFSHQSFIHLFLNMYVLWSFAPQTMREFTGVEQFCALYASAGVVSSLISLSHKAITKSPIRALGASGAILGIITYACMKMPNARIQMLFIPFFDFSAQSAVYGLLLFDIIGLLGPWKMFDHAAHLGGSLFGIWYATYGEKFVRNWYNKKVIDVYQKIKQND